MKYINDADAETLKRMFSEMKDDVKLTYFISKEDCETCPIAEELLTELSSLSEKITLTTHDFNEETELVEKYAIDKVPALVVESDNDYGIRFYGVPSGYEFNSLLNAVQNVSRGGADLPGVIREDLDKIEKEIHVQVFVTPTCPHCPNAVKTAQNFALYSDKIKADMIEVSEFPEMAEKYEVMSVPKIVINESVSFVGSLGDREYLEKILEANK